MHSHLEGEDRLEDDEHRAEVSENATKALQAQFLLDAIVEQEKVSVSQPELVEYLVMSAQQYGMSPDAFAQAVDEAGQVQSMVAEVARRKALAVVLEQGGDHRRQRQRRRPRGSCAPTDADEASRRGDAERGRRGRCRRELIARRPTRGAPDDVRCPFAVREHRSRGGPERLRSRRTPGVSGVERRGSTLGSMPGRRTRSPQQSSHQGDQRERVRKRPGRRPSVGGWAWTTTSTTGC